VKAPLRAIGKGPCEPRALGVCESMLSHRHWGPCRIDPFAHRICWVLESECTSASVRCHPSLLAHVLLHWGGMFCIICLDSHPPVIQSGCACRSDSGLAHLDWLIEKWCRSRRPDSEATRCGGSARRAGSTSWGRCSRGLRSVVVAGVRAGGGESAEQL
jgi:hypothetical protein